MPQLFPRLWSSPATPPPAGAGRGGILGISFPRRNAWRIRVSPASFVAGWRRLGLFLLLCAGAVFSAAGQTDAPAWSWSHPEPHGNNTVDLLFRDGLYLQITDHGGVYTSTNRVDWVRQNTGTLRDLRGAAFLGPRLLITGESGTALWSEDARTFQAATVSPATTDWLEGVATGPDLGVAVGDNGAVYLTTNGLAWERVSFPFSEWLTGVAYGAGAFVAVGESGLIARSTTGRGWTRQDSGTTRDLERVVYGDGAFLIVGAGGTALTSSDGITWSADLATGQTNAILAAVAIPGERLAVGESAFLLRKPPGAWENQFLPAVSPLPPPDWVYAAALWDGERYLVSGRAGVSVESFRTNTGVLSDRTFWLRTEGTPRNWLWDTHRAGGTYIAVGDQGTLLTSPTGTRWAAESSGVPTNVVLYGIGSSPELAVVVGGQGTILTSPTRFAEDVLTNRMEVDGVTHALVVTNRVPLLGIDWQAVDPAPTTNTLQGIGWNNGLFVAVGAQGTVLRSTDAKSWVSGTIGSTAFLSSVTPYAGGWIASGSLGSLYTSPDATTWSRQDLGITDWIYRVRNLGGSLVAVGQNGMILLSTNALSWIRCPSGTEAWMTDVARIGDWYVACGTQGVLLRSRNLKDWEQVPMITGKALYGMATDGPQAVVAGAEGAILRALVAPELFPVTISVFWHAHTAGDSVADVFVFGGRPGQKFQLESSTNLLDWSVAGGLEIGSAGARSFGVPSSVGPRFYRTTALP